jgi:hypothetical protein
LSPGALVSTEALGQAFLERGGMSGARQSLVGIAALALLGAGFLMPVQAAEFYAGGYSFSDELGGFRLLSATGSGSPSDPFVVTEELFEVAPVTLVIRNHDLLRPRGPIGQAEITLVKQVANLSDRVWAGFELELQELLGTPSDYGDGLSFKQFSAKPPDVFSDAFAKNERRFEPADRIEFLDGHVDPQESATFSIKITDPTPVPVFYIVQDPKLLSAGLPEGRTFASR